MDFGARIGWAIVIYAVVFLAEAGMITYGWTQGAGPRLLDFLILVIVCLWAGSQLKFRNWKDILSYSVGWAVIVLALDALYTVPLEGWSWYQGWLPWVSFVLVAALPPFSTLLRKKIVSPHGPWES